jgi:chromosome segregation ATPase
VAAAEQRAKGDREAAERRYAELVAQSTTLQQQLGHAVAEWRHCDAQYSQLHKEMLQLLDQRDEARRDLEALKRAR